MRKHQRRAGSSESQIRRELIEMCICALCFRLVVVATFLAGVSVVLEIAKNFRRMITGSYEGACLLSHT